MHDVFICIFAVFVWKRFHYYHDYYLFYILTYRFLWVCERRGWHWQLAGERAVAERTLSKLLKDLPHVRWIRMGENILWSTWSRVVRPTGDVVTSTAKDELHRGGESRLLISTHYLSLWPFKSYQTSFIPLNKGRKEEYLWKYFGPFPSYQDKDIVPYIPKSKFSQHGSNFSYNSELFAHDSLFLCKGMLS